MQEWEHSFTTGLSLIKSMLAVYHQMIMPILLENWLCLLLQKTWFKSISEEDQLELKQMSLPLLLHSLNMLKIIRFQHLVFKFLDLIIATMDRLLLPSHAALLMLIAKVFLLSHGLKLIILNLNIHLLNSNTKIKLRKIDASMVLRKLLLKEKLVRLS